MKTRLHFLDNLRTFLIFLVILLHAGITYVSGMDSFWIVSDPNKIDALSLVNMYLDLFVMFIIFFISGYFIPGSIKGKTTSEFLKSKFKRIMLPWIIAVFTLIPAYKAIFLYSRGLPQEEWYTYFHVFQRTGSDLSFFANNPTQSWLWFLPVLFLFQVIYLGLSKTNLLNLKISLKTGVVLSFVVGLAYSLAISFSGLKGWTHSPLFDFQRERLGVYLVAFLLGSLCYKLRVFESNNKNKKFYIISNVVLTVALGIFTTVALNLFFNMVDPERNYFFISETLDRILYYASAVISMFSFLHIFLYAFQFNFNKSNTLFKHLSKNSYSVYIIHMIVLGVLALVLVNMPIPSLVKYFILTVLTFIISNLLVYAYDRLFNQNTSSRIIKVTLFIVVVISLGYFISDKEAIADTDKAMVSQTEIPAIKVSIHMAVIQGNMEAIKFHIEDGSDLNKKEPSGGSSPLITAATFGKTEVALALIEAGADVNFQNNEGSTPLHTAAFFCRTDIVKVLLSNGADASIINNVGSTALESVTVPFDLVKPYYDYFANTLGPLGLKLDYEQIQDTRPVIAEILLNETSD